MLQKKNEGILFSAEIRVVGSYTDRLLSGANSLFNWRFRCRRNHAKALYFLKPKVKENIIKKIYSYWTVSQQSLAFVFFERCRLS